MLMEPVMNVNQVLIAHKANLSVALTHVLDVLRTLIALGTQDSKNASQMEVAWNVIQTVTVLGQLPFALLINVSLALNLTLVALHCSVNLLENVLGVSLILIAPPQLHHSALMIVALPAQMTPIVLILQGH